MTRVYVPQTVQVVHDSHTLVLSPGIQSIPDELENHWWLTANGVTVIRPTLLQL